MVRGPIRPDDEAPRRRRQSGEHGNYNNYDNYRDSKGYDEYEEYDDYDGREEREEYDEQYEDEAYEDEAYDARQEQLRQQRQSGQQGQPRPRPRTQRTQNTQNTQRTSQTSRTPRTTQRIQQSARRSLRPRGSRRPRVWPILLGGCVLGVLFSVVAAAVVIFFTVRSAQTGGVPIIGGGGIVTQAYTSSATQAITLGTLTQLQVCDKVGNVTIAVDPSATTPSIQTTKTVHMSSQTSAEQEFERIAVNVQQLASPQSLTCDQSTATGTPGTPSALITPTTSTTTSASEGALLVSTSIPDSTGLIHGTGDSVDLKITLTPQLFASESAPLQLNIQAALGNISVDGVSGVFNIIGSSGNVSVTHAILITGSSIGTGQGDVTFNGILAVPSDSSTQANFVIRSEQGKMDVTLPATSNFVLSANTNVGTIQSDFPINATNSSGSATYRGPINSAASLQSQAILTIDVSTGDISIHKGTTSG